MPLDSDLKLEVISSLFGQNFQPYDKKRGWKRPGSLSVDEFHLHNLTGKRARAGQTFIDEKYFFDSEFDCDFTNLSDSSQCKRGDEVYERPKGWYRIALNVKGKYPDGDTWLGDKRWRSHSVPGEWPVSYHGTSLKGATGIIRSNYNAGDRAMYGRGIYSTPDIHVAEREEYAKTFTSKTTGKRYKVILQNRINPKLREICRRRDYWLIGVPKGASAEKERDIVESSIRPYGILIKELDEDEDYDEGDGGYDEDDSDECSDSRDNDGSDYGNEDGDDNEDDEEDDDYEDDGEDGKYDEGNVTCSCDDDDDDDDDDGDDGDNHDSESYGDEGDDDCEEEDDEDNDSDSGDDIYNEADDAVYDGNIDDNDDDENGEDDEDDDHFDDNAVADGSSTNDDGEQNNDDDDGEDDEDHDHFDDNADGSSTNNDADDGEQNDYYDENDCYNEVDGYDCGSEDDYDWS